MTLIGAANTLLGWFYLLFDVALLAFTLWAFVDCLIRPGYAFGLAGRKSKWVWLLITGFPAIVQVLTIVANGSVYMSLFLAFLSGLYLFDVRPAVRDYSGNRSRRRGSGGGHTGSGEGSGWSGNYGTGGEPESYDRWGGGTPDPRSW
ncbi:MAG: DUF2516 family protein [Varibaculum sp.]|nr:DUF2516 family protein [Varibaculum sp.]